MDRVSRRPLVEIELATSMVAIFCLASDALKAES